MNRYSYIRLPDGCRIFGSGSSPEKVDLWFETWSDCSNRIKFFLVLAASRTAEVKGISAAGATPDARRYTAIADAELLLNGPSHSARWSLPPLPAGVSPALISHIATQMIGLEPVIVPLGLLQEPTFPFLQVESPCEGPSECLSTGKAMAISRVDRLWQCGLSIGRNLTEPLLLAECVPGGTTTAQAVLTGLGLPVGDLISGSVCNPPTVLKTELVEEGLMTSGLGVDPLPRELIAAIGDPFQPFAAGLLLGAREVNQKVMLAGGSQMLAVLALALLDLDDSLRSGFVEGVSLATTSWLVGQSNKANDRTSDLILLMKLVEDLFHVDLLGLSTGLRFDKSSQRVLRDYEEGHVKEGVGAGGLALLAQIRGISLSEFVDECEKGVCKLNRGLV